MATLEIAIAMCSWVSNFWTFTIVIVVNGFANVCMQLCKLLPICTHTHHFS